MHTAASLSNNLWYVGRRHNLLRSHANDVLALPATFYTSKKATFLLTQQGMATWCYHCMAVSDVAQFLAHHKGIATSQWVQQWCWSLSKMPELQILGRMCDNSVIKAVHALGAILVVIAPLIQLQRGFSLLLPYLTLGAHAQQGLRYLLCVCVCVCLLLFSCYRHQTGSWAIPTALAQQALEK